MNSINRDNLINIQFVEDIINNYNGSAHLKDINSGKYIFSNEINAQHVGVGNAKNLYGLTVMDLNQHMHKNWGNLAQRIELFEAKLKYQYMIIMDDNQISIAPNGNLAIHNMKKYPLLNSQNKTIAVVTTSELITSKLDLLQQLDFYLIFYKIQGNKFAINAFLSSINIRHYFLELPTCSELTVLLHKQKEITAKSIAEKLSLSITTIETHLKKLDTKLILI